MILVVMSIEGGGRWHFGNLEIPKARKLEVEKGFGVESSPEQEDTHWLSGTLTADLIEKVRVHPAHRDWTPERIILESLVGKLVESGPELDPAVRTRLGNLVQVFRWVAFSNMRPKEQDFLRMWAKADTAKIPERQVEITTELIEDIQWIWRRFNLDVSPNERAESLLGYTGESKGLKRNTKPEKLI